MKKNNALILCLAVMCGGINPTSAAPTLAGQTENIPTASALCAETDRNRVIMTKFADIFYRRQDIERAMMTYVVPDYIQHSPRIPNGRAAMLEMAKHFKTSTATFQVKRIVVDGDMAVVYVRGQLSPTAPVEAVVDMFRLKDGKIVEHWDVVQAVPAASANKNTMF
jgi:predicted SnoaL-like aldol condensation-catalyzing enzyme